MQTNTKYIELNVVTVNRAELILPASKAASFLCEADNRGFMRQVDNYDDIYIILPWTAQRKDLKEFVKLVFEFTGALDDFRAWLDDAVVRFEAVFYYVAAAKRGSIRQLKTPNPNPNKWFNKQWPATLDFPTNMANAFLLLDTERIGPICLEVNCPLSTDDLGLLCAGIRESFPMTRLIQVAQGHEHAIDPVARNEMYLAATRLLFDVSAVPENDYHALFSRIETMHSFIVPVMRVFPEPPEMLAEGFQWGL